MWLQGFLRALPAWPMIDQWARKDVGKTSDGVAASPSFTYDWNVNDNRKLSRMFC